MIGREAGGEVLLIIRGGPGVEEKLAAVLRSSTWVELYLLSGACQAKDSLSIFKDASTFRSVQEIEIVRF